MSGLLEKKTVLIVVRTYPTPAQKGVEVSCTAGITADGRWIRLFPVPYRFLASDKRFKKYQWIQVSVKKASDARPESYEISSDSITILPKPLSTTNNWAERKNLLFPRRAYCLCCLKRERDRNGFPTLGFFRPKSIKRLLVADDTPNWTDQQLQALRQKDMFAESPKAELEKVPYKFRYEFRCDDAECSGHKIICTDWEMGQSWRSWSRDYRDDWETKFRQKYEHEMINKNDTHFFVGTVRGHPDKWIIVGLFYPRNLPSTPQGTMPLFG